MRLTTVTIYLLIINGLILSFGITQKVLDFNLIDETIEAFAWALVGSFQLVVLSFYFASRREEEVALTTSIQNIESLLAQIVQSNSILLDENKTQKEQDEK